jgi:hypothetical protein
VTDAALVGLVGAGGSGRLDWLTGSDAVSIDEVEYAWRTWVDEVVASWAACLLTTPELATDAVAALAGCDHVAGVPTDFRRLTEPNDHDRRAAALLRHPDLLAPVADLHRASLLRHLQGDSQSVA